MTTYNPTQVKKAYSSGQDVSKELKDRIATKYMPLVKKIAASVARKAPSSISIDDLIGAGMVGLVDAAGRYDPERAEQFKAFAEARIRGAMIDELRSQGPLSRDLRTKSNQISKTIRDLEHQLGRQPEEDEIADEMGIPIEKYHALLVSLQQQTVLSPAIVDQTMDRPKGYFNHVPGNPQDNYLYAELQDRLALAIGSLPDREQRVLAMYYKDEISLKEIGEKFGVTESRACQIRTEAIHRLRAKLREDSHG